MVSVIFMAVILHENVIFLPVNERSCLISTGARVGLEQTFFGVMEDVEVIELCVFVFEPLNISCPIHFSFNIHLNTADGTACKIYSL